MGNMCETMPGDNRFIRQQWAKCKGSFKPRKIIYKEEEEETEPEVEETNDSESDYDPK